MPKICANADIQTVPCAGSVFSRAIKCRAGQTNTCLRNCSEKCPAYKAVDSRKSAAPVPAKQPVRSPAIQWNVRAAATPVNQPARSSGCGTCGRK